jgi:hypothetical protein
LHNGGALEAAQCIPSHADRGARHHGEQKANGGKLMRVFNKLEPPILTRVRTTALQCTVECSYNAVHESREMARGRPKTKTSVMTLRVSPEIKAAAEIAAERDHRSVTSLIEVLILNHCKELNIQPETIEQKENRK